MECVCSEQTDIPELHVRQWYSALREADEVVEGVTNVLVVSETAPRCGECHRIPYDLSVHSEIRSVYYITSFRRGPVDREPITYNGRFPACAVDCIHETAIVHLLAQA